MNELEAVIPARELDEWMTYAQLEPFGPLAAWERFAVMASITANAHRDPKRGRPFRAADFMPRAEAADRPRRSEPAEVKAALLAAFAGRVVQKGS